MENEVDFEDINPFFKVEQQVSQNRSNVLIQREDDKHLHDKVLHLTQQNEALKRNISCLYRTARLEIQKCEHKLCSLQEELSCQTSVSTCDAYTQTPPQSNNTTRTNSSSNSDRRRGRGKTREPDKSSCDRHKERYSTDRERRKRLHSTSPVRVKKDLHRKRLDDLNNKVKKRRTSSIENKKPSKRQKTAKTTKITTNQNQQNITNTNDIEEGEIVSSDDN